MSDEKPICPHCGYENKDTCDWEAEEIKAKKAFLEDLEIRMEKNYSYYGETVYITAKVLYKGEVILEDFESEQIDNGSSYEY